jgi:hypothetical protein
MVALLFMRSPKNRGASGRIFHFSKIQGRRSAYLDASGIPSAEITMVGIFAEEVNSVKRTPLGPGLVPQKILPFMPRIGFLTLNTLHLFTLPADDGDIHACFHIISLDTNRRFLCVDNAGVKKGADHFAQLAAATLLFVNLNSHRPTHRSKIGFSPQRHGEKFLFVGRYRQTKIFCPEILIAFGAAKGGQPLTC